MMNPPPMPLQQEAYEMPMPNPNLMFLYNQAQPPRPTLPPPAFPPGTFPPAPFPMPPAKNVHYPGGKGHDQNPASSIWENFDMQ
jgi:hypothetical protein